MNLIFFTVSLTTLVYRSYTRKSLTPLGIASAILTACVHGIHPWNLPFVLLITFFVLGIWATRVKHEVKAHLTVSSTGAAGGEGPRSHIQVFANSLAATVLTFLHAHQLGVFSSFWHSQSQDVCFENSLLVIGIIANYAAVTADTLSSELGILSRTAPRLITTLRPCPPGINGGVSSAGLLAGAGGAAAIGLTALLFMPFCTTWTSIQKVGFVAFVTAVGTLGSLLDSLLGAILQASVVDVRSGKVVEAPRGGRVLVKPSDKALTMKGEAMSKLSGAPGTATAAVGLVGDEDRAGSHSSRKVVSGYDVLSNNGVNFSMAVLISLAAMAAAGFWWSG